MMMMMMMKGGLLGSLGLSPTQLSTEIHFWTLFISYWLDKVICVTDPHRDTTWCIALCKCLGENYGAGRSGGKGEKKANTRKQRDDIEICRAGRAH